MQDAGTRTGSDDPLAGLLETATDEDTRAKATAPATPERVIAECAEDADFRAAVKSVNAFPPYQSEEENPAILIKGRWLERGGSAWWVSTAGTGKSVASLQTAYCWGAGIPFAGLTPYGRLRTWIIQSEDSPSRITIDREDITKELSERFPDIDWHAVGEEMVKFVKIPAAVGPEFLERLDGLLTTARRMSDEKHNYMPDVVQLNPFMAFIGGPVSDGAYVTPFLRGGEINGRHTDGLQALLEKHDVATLIFHHTPKPPTEKEVASWLKSMFPEYQGAGSSDITNWGRSFITMMKVPNHSRMVCMVAGKNGNEIGWEEIGGTRRRYLCYSDAVGITGGSRHAWRELNEDERAEIIGGENDTEEAKVSQAVSAIVEDLHHKPAMYAEEIVDVYQRRFSQRIARAAKTRIWAHASKYRLSVVPVKVGKTYRKYIGYAEGIAKVRSMMEQSDRIEEMNGEAEKAEKAKKSADPAERGPAPATPAGDCPSVTSTDSPKAPTFEPGTLGEVFAQEDGDGFDF